MYVLADGVSSCNKEEVAIALDRLRGEGVVVTTSSESWVYECMGDAGIEGVPGSCEGGEGDGEGLEGGAWGVVE